MRQAFAKSWHIVIVTILLGIMQGAVLWLTPAQSARVSIEDSGFAYWLHPVYAVESALDAQTSESFRWMQRQSTVRLYGAPAPRDMVVELQVHSGRGADTQTTLTMTQPQLSYTVTMPTGWRTLSILVPATESTAWYRELQFAVNGADIADTRPLGMAVRALTMADTMQAPLVMASLWRWAYLLLLWIWVVPLVFWRRWPWWSLCVWPILLMVGVWWAPLSVAMLLPSTWSILAMGYFAGALVVLPRWSMARWPWVWLPLLVIAVVLFAVQYVWLASVCLLLAWKLRDTDTLSPSGESAWDVSSWGIVGIGLLAVLVRVLWLDDYPIGMFRDEARHGLLAQAIADGQRLIYSTFADLPAGYFYVSALPVAWLGHSAFAIRLVAALAGSLTVLAAYWVLSPWWGKAWAMWTSLVIAVMLWHVGLSRIAWPATMGPLLTLIAIGSLARGLQYAPFRWGIVAGIATGAMTLFYHSSRVMPVVVVASVVIMLAQRGWPWRDAWRVLLSWMLASIVMALPMIIYALADFTVYMRRIGATSITQYASDNGIPALYAIFENLRVYVGMFFVSGDTNPRHYALGIPQLSPIESVLGLIGMLVLLSPQRRLPAIFVAIWLVVGMVPGVLSVNAPHALRTVEAIVPVAMLVAQGGMWLGQWLQQRWRSLLLVAYACVMLLWGGVTYVHWQHNPQTLYAYDARVTAVAKWIVAHPQPEVQWYVPKRWLNDDVVLYFVGPQVLGGVNGTDLTVPVVRQGIIVIHPTSPLPTGAQSLPLPPAFAAYSDSLQFACVGDCQDVAWLYDER